MRKLGTILLVLGLLACGVTAAAAEGEIPVSTDQAEMRLTGNRGFHYINGNGMGHSPPTSFLYANGKGGVTLVQFISAGDGVTVAEYDSDLQFVSFRSVPVEGLTDWGGFCAGEDYNYVVYAVDKAVIRVDQYDKEWNPVNHLVHTFGNTRSFISNDMDLAVGGGSLFIVTNHIMSDGAASGHEANLRLQVDESTLRVTAEHSGVGDYDGYCSHSFVPETLWAGGILYTLDRCDAFPGAGIYLCAFDGSLNRGLSMQGIKAMAFRDWGNIGSAAAAGQALITAYNYADGDDHYTNTDVFLNRFEPGGGSQTVQVSYSGGAGTPYAAAVDDSFGYVLWNTDIRSDMAPVDTLFYAPYYVGDSLTVGEVRTAEGNFLSDCDPISWQGGLLWFTTDGRDVTFHRLGTDGTVTKTTFHDPVEREAVAPTVWDVGYTAGTQCSRCGAWLSGHEEIPRVEALISEAAEDGGSVTARFQCSRSEYTAIFAAYGEGGRLLQAETAEYSVSGSQAKSFQLPEGWERCKVMLIDSDGCPLCPAWESGSSAPAESE